jgi:Cys-tRNA(Pro)/Cys-tRNA(Cys) deacylase
VGRTPAEILEQAGVPFAVHPHAPVASVAEILVALPFPAEEHVKTLAVEADGRIALAALRGSDRLGFGLLEPGGVCPLVDRSDVTVLVDCRVPGLPRVFCGSGRADATLELAGADLVAASGARVAELAAP